MEANFTTDFYSNLAKQMLSQKKVLNTEELVIYTGLSETTIHRLTTQRKIPHSQPLGRKLFFDREKIDEWLLSKPRRSADEIAEEAASITFGRKRA
ncbi:MAG: hypothetical protein RL308_1570 [Bacteroidota bacterium]|jgi:excisionase family DNA binding protein